MPGLRSAGVTDRYGPPSARTRVSADPTSATVLAGRYELLEAIGGGGMGVVYRAVDSLLGRTVAVKLLRLDHDAESSVLRFEREARAAAVLSHPNIVSVFDAGTDGATHYIVMEHVPGISLARLFAEHDQLTVPAAVDIASQISKGLAAAHGVGVVHRDVKPANVMVGDAGAVKLLDFGIARMYQEASLTPTGSILGSARYIAPEVARGAPADDRSDVYSFGCVLYESLTGRPPFAGDGLAAIVHQHLHAHPRPLRDQNPEIPERLAELTMSMLAKHRAERPAAAAVELSLEPLRGDSARSHHAAWPAIARTPTHGTTQLLRVRRRRRPSIAIVAAAALILLTAGVLMINALGGGGSTERANGATRRHVTAARKGHHRAPPVERLPSSQAPPKHTQPHPPSDHPKHRPAGVHRHKRTTPPQEAPETRPTAPTTAEGETPSAPAETPTSSTSTPTAPPPTEPEPQSTPPQPPPTSTTAPAG